MNKQKEDRSIDKVWNLLLENGYTLRLLKRLLREVQRSGAKRGGVTGEGGKGETGEGGMRVTEWIQWTGF